MTACEGCGEHLYYDGHAWLHKVEPCQTPDWTWCECTEAEVKAGCVTHDWRASSKPIEYTRP